MSSFRPSKVASIAGTTSFGVLPFLSGFGCSECQETKTTNVITSHPMQQHGHAFGEQKPINLSLQNFVSRVPSMT